ncbi:hypothetical protein ACQ4M4_13275 [Leptolyngbya sp. AN02str]|uniref:hypothetical protein n=1 Tax=Leptolyngbya sp. AN02str TaxID=3423363 RepID=UPI003D313881
MLLLLLGCRPDPICVSAIDTRAEHLTLSFTKPKERQSRISDVRIISITFRRQVDNQILWLVEFRRQSDEPLNVAERDSQRVKLSRGSQLDTITYGTVPEGFYVPDFVGTATPLKSGEAIEVRVNGTISFNYFELTLD